MTAQTALVAVPTLDDLASDPTRAASLPPGVARDLHSRVVVVLAALLPALHADPPREAAEPDRLVPIAEAAVLLGCSRDSLYRKAAEYPFTVHQGRSLRFSLHGIQRWIARHQGS